VTDLIVHIGLPKAASTTLQRNLFSGTAGYLGKSFGANNDLGWQFRNITPTEDLSFWTSEARSWVARAIECKKHLWPETQRLIVSHEDLSQRQTNTYRQKRPIGSSQDVSGQQGDLQRHFTTTLLKGFKDYIWKSGNVKALIVLRNQPEWLASLYVTLSNTFKSASQKDFEAQVQKLIQHGEDYIDWSRWVDDLQQALGQENVCTLLMEDMKQEKFWKELATFMELDDVDPFQFAKLNATKYNVRRFKDNSWKISPLKKRKPLAARLIRKYRDYKRLPNTRLVLNDLTRRMFSSFTPSIAAINGANKRYTEIEMTASLRESILEYCRPFNDRLAKQLNRNDLREIGY